MPKACAIANDDEALVQVCGGESMAEKAKDLWEDIKAKRRLDVSDQHMTDDEVQRLIKGLHMCDAITFAAVQPSARGRASHRCGPSDARALRAGLRA